MTDKCGCGQKDNIFCTPSLEILEDSNGKVTQTFTWVCIQLVKLLNNCTVVPIVIRSIFLVIKIATMKLFLNWFWKSLVEKMNYTISKTGNSYKIFSHYWDILGTNNKNSLWDILNKGYVKTFILQKQSPWYNLLKIV